MNDILILRPGRSKLSYACFVAGNREPALTVSGIDCRSAQNDQAALKTILAEIRENFRKVAGVMPAAIGVRGTFGGTLFSQPTRVNAKVIANLKHLMPQAPLHLPPLVNLVEACTECFSGTPVVLVFETAFFVNLPAKEQLYALEPGLSASLELRRFGYHGLFHEAACLWVVRERLAKGLEEPARILSVCLEPRPEITAVLGRRPLMVTSGATPLEGLPGETNCGEMDPGLLLLLAKQKNWGPEELNLLLTQKSGLLGLAGRPVTFAELFKSASPDLAEAREIVLYHMLCACGAGLAALGGLDEIVFCGRYAAAGETVGPWLADRLIQGTRNLVRPSEKPWRIFKDSLMRIVADATEAKDEKIKTAAKKKKASGD